jgi:hypothetical protein
VAHHAAGVAEGLDDTAASGGDAGGVESVVTVLQAGGGAAAMDWEGAGTEGEQVWVYCFCKRGR